MSESITSIRKMYLSQIEELKSELANAVQRGDEQFDRAERLQEEVDELKRRIDLIESKGELLDE